MAFATDPSVATQIQNRLKGLYELVNEIENARGASEANVERIDKLQSEIKAEESKLNSVKQRKLKLVYNRAVDNAKEEERLLREALEKIKEIRQIKNEVRVQARSAGNKEVIRRVTLMKMLMTTAQTLPLYIGKKSNAKVPPLCGSVPAESSYIAKVGDMVAAFVKGAEQEENWILAEVISFNPTTNKYEIDDVDEEEKERYVVSKRRVVPLPFMRVNPETDGHALFPNGSTVLALYPQTTCFYKAMISSQPTTAQEEYEVFFEDSSYTEGYSPSLKVPQRYVIAYKDIKKRETDRSHGKK